MPKRLLKLSRTEPARTILMVVAFLTIVLELLTLLPFYTPFAHIVPQLANVVIVDVIAGWGLVSSAKNNPKQMSMSSFWLFVIWLWSGFVRLFFSPVPFALGFFPLFVVAAVLAVVYIYLSYHRKAGDLD